ncbi:BON1-associated protein 2-like [Pyrus ussuriensis x Pyrus communis]|uniref:BON1-associated protein 2-like n=1 Tax=Pyrus ussuriensis x Pyrus communis TaxID=2448454 RepID=A0A5N5F062_9ROSA|nr:BON1-associated protein 2-like [Pyrus ussuriensis x Pyrus communis]
MAANFRTLEITVISAENLQLDRKPIKTNASVTVRTDTNSQFCTTDIDTEGGAYARWNEKLVLDLPTHSKSITVKVQCKTAYGVRTFGTATVLASDFVGAYVPEGYPHFLSYRLRDYKGERNGVINISVRMKVPEMYACASSTTSSHSRKGFPADGNHSFGGGVAIGVPVWYGAYQKNY